MSNVQIPQEALSEILATMPDKQRQSIQHMLRSTVTHTVHCMSEDRYEDQDVPIVDKDGSPVLHKSGKNKGQPKTERKTVLVQPGCKGRHIANITKTNVGGKDKVRVIGILDEDGNQYCRVHRFRLDGHLGFKCLCKNDSRIAEQEAGTFDYKGTIPSKEQLNEVFARVRKKPSQYPVVSGEQYIDGFCLREAL